MMYSLSMLMDFPGISIFTLVIQFHKTFIYYRKYLIALLWMNGCGAGEAAEGRQYAGILRKIIAGKTQALFAWPT